MYGISNFHAVINTPQAGILAVGEVKAKPVVTDSGEIEARQLMGVTLACDHRILYGADGAEFLARVRRAARGAARARALAAVRKGIDQEESRGHRALVATAVAGCRR